jgi:hypothetical protein
VRNSSGEFAARPWQGHAQRPALHLARLRLGEIEPGHGGDENRRNHLTILDAVMTGPARISVTIHFAIRDAFMIYELQAARRTNSGHAFLADMNGVK